MKKFIFSFLLVFVLAISGFSGRIPLGVYFAPIRYFDFVLEFAPGAGFYAWDSNVEPDYGMSGSLGVRYWF
jgi:hypothetical protein